VTQPSEWQQRHAAFNRRQQELLDHVVAAK